VKIERISSRPLCAVHCLSLPLSLINSLLLFFFFLSSSSSSFLKKEREGGGGGKEEKKKRFFRKRVRSSRMVGGVWGLKKGGDYLLFLPFFIIFIIII